MTDRAQAVLREALTLPIEERADVAAELLASLDDEPTEDLAEVEMAWAKEIERRARQVLAGETTGEPWEDVRARIEQSLRQR
ncbi:MAG TPA: addiction module protein [Thermoanaerobaculia bacterium]|jgi:putative addiction module component (TIGR02574 family)|nr:addiction module protein [Thermoanaerobaculia bacterium]